MMYSRRIDCVKDVALMSRLGDVATLMTRQIAKVDTNYFLATISRIVAPGDCGTLPGSIWGIIDHYVDNQGCRWLPKEINANKPGWTVVFHHAAKAAKHVCYTVVFTRLPRIAPTQTSVCCTFSPQAVTAPLACLLRWRHLYQRVCV